MWAMDSLRFYTLAASLFVATFAGGMWVLGPRPAATEQSATPARASTPAPEAAKHPEATKPPEVAKQPEVANPPSGMVPLKPDSRLPTFHHVEAGGLRTRPRLSSATETRHG
jgi:hypothetical protein